MAETRRGFLRGAAGGVLGALAGGGAWAQSGRRAPNVVLIVAEDLGAMDTEPYGADLHETPNLKRLAGEGCGSLRRIRRRRCVRRRGRRFRRGSIRRGCM
ncbi:MAG: sulfatase-like hydrolase/transferase [Bryobacterales bacterium]|nr:sulfatase-like hydrolase/transferase [Bryobacterales bacterium]